MGSGKKIKWGEKAPWRIFKLHPQQVQHLAYGDPIKNLLDAKPFNLGLHTPVNFDYQAFFGPVTKYSKMTNKLQLGLNWMISYSETYARAC